MARVSGNEIVMDRAHGAHLYDEAGNRYLDAAASLWYCNVGYGRSELGEIASRQITQLAAYQMFEGYATRPALDLADRLATIAPMPEAASFFTCGGSDAVDTACKIVRRYWQVVGKPERRLIVARSEAYHGMNAYGTSLAGIEANAQGWGTLIPDVVHVPYDDPRALSAALQQNRGKVAAFIGEPVIAAGGVYAPEANYWTDVQRICRQHDVLLIADEVVTGFGRLGSWFGCERFGIEPDVVTGAKGITSGYLPLGVVLASQRVQEPLWAAGVFRHGYTYSGHAAACAVALGNLDIIEREGLLGRVAALEPVLRQGVTSLQDAPLVCETRSIGLMAAVELDTGARARHPDLMDRIVAACRDRGLLVRGLLARHIQISPPLIIDTSEIEFIVQTLGEVLHAVDRRLALASA